MKKAGPAALEVKVKVENRVNLVFLFVVMLAAKVSAGALGWQDVLYTAMKKNPSMLQSIRTLEQAKWNYYSTFSNFLPQVSVSAGDSRNGTTLTNDYSLGISGRLNVFSGFGNIAESGMKGLEVKIASENYRRIVADEIYNLRKSFTNLLVAQEMIKLSKDIYERRIKNYELIKLRYEAGREDKGSYMRVGADKFQIETEVNQYKRNLQVAAAQLCRDMGRAGYEALTVTGTFSLEQSGVNVDYEKLLKNIPEYLLAAYKLDKSKLEVISVKSSLYPGVSLSAGSSRSGDDFPLSDSSWSAGLNLSWPIFTSGKNLIKVKTAYLARQIYELSLFETTQRLRAALISAWNTFLCSVENVNVRGKYLEASKEQSDITTMKYLNGLVTYYEWYNVENDYINAQKSSLSAKSDALLAEAAWKKTLGIGE